MIVIIIVTQHVNAIEISILKECRSECECGYHSDLPHIHPPAPTTRSSIVPINNHSHRHTRNPVFHFAS
jgi:hypothetical protein